MSRSIAKVLLIAIPVLAVAGIFFAGIMHWREKANRLRCQDNLRRVGWYAVWSYTDREFAFPEGPDLANRTRVLELDKPLDPNKTFPPGTLPNPNLPPHSCLAWSVILLPYLQREDLYRKFDLTLGWDDPPNHEAVMTRVTTLACPSIYRQPPPGEPTPGHYIGLTGLGADSPWLGPTDPRAGFFRYDKPTTTGMVRRGFSHTITFMETEIDHGPWPAGGKPTLRGLVTEQSPYIGLGRQFGGHAGGCNAAFADGSVRFQSHSISPKVLESLVTLMER